MLVFMFINFGVANTRCGLLGWVSEKASAGVMISASHNPALITGQVFAVTAINWDDDRELEIEALLDATEDTYHVQVLRD